MFDFGCLGFSSMETGRPAAIQLDDPVGFRRAHDIAEDGCAGAAQAGARQRLRQRMAVEDIVAEDESHPVGADEIGADDEGIGQPARLLLDRIGEGEPEIGAVTEQALEQMLVLRRGDQQNVPDPGEHQRRQRVIDHRLVEHRKQLLGNDRGHRVKPRARSPRQNDALHRATVTRTWLAPGNISPYPSVPRKKCGGVGLPRARAILLRAGWAKTRGAEAWQICRLSRHPFPASWPSSRPVFGDGRGFFMELFNAGRYAAVGITAPLVQDNLSRSTRGVLRGLHLQNPHPQGKLVTALRGTVLDVAVDVRLGSPSFGQHVKMELSEESRRQLWVPRGFAHGFVVDLGRRRVLL